jgi:HEPN domain-containing protein
VNQQQGFEALSQAERLLAEAEQNPAAARAAAQAALRSLLFEWGETPRAESVVGLVDQAAEVDESLKELRAEAMVLDRFNPGPDAGERAKIFVDAARARLVNI